MRLAPLWALRRAADAKAGTSDAIPGAARGIAHQLCEAWGSLDVRIATLPKDLRLARGPLRRHGVVFGRRSIFLPRLLRPDAANLLAILWGSGLEQSPAPPQPGITSFEPEPWFTDGFLAAAGFRRVGGRAVRLDILERLEDELEQAARSGATAEALRACLLSLLGCHGEALDDILNHLQWGSVSVGEGETAVAVLRRKSQPPEPRRKHRPRSHTRASSHSPFAELASLISVD
jgi:ATP-dependent RNA helicase SUPV3L1/SUV3